MRNSARTNQQQPLTKRRVSASSCKPIMIEALVCRLLFGCGMWLCLRSISAKWCGQALSERFSNLRDNNNSRLRRAYSRPLRKRGQAKVKSADECALSALSLAHTVKCVCVRLAHWTGRKRARANGAQKVPEGDGAQKFQLNANFCAGFCIAWNSSF